MMIFLFFKPLQIKQQEFVDVPLLEMQVFTMYELDTKGLKTILFGSNSKRFSDRYTVKNIDYTDSAREYIANMKADSGVYKDENISLSGNVEYARENGLTFQSDTAHYDKKSSIFSTDKEFVVFKGQSSAIGTSLHYNNVTKKMKATKMKAIYQLQESNE